MEQYRETGNNSSSKPSSLRLVLIEACAMSFVCQRHVRVWAWMRAVSSQQSSQRKWRCHNEIEGRALNLFFVFFFKCFTLSLFTRKGQLTKAFCRLATPQKRVCAASYQASTAAFIRLLL